MYNIDSHVFIYTYYIYIVCHVVTGCFQPFGGESLYLDSSLIILFSEAAGAWFSRAAGSQSQHAATLAYLLEKFMVIPTVCSKKSWNPDPFHVIIYYVINKKKWLYWWHVGLFSNSFTSLQSAAACKSSRTQVVPGKVKPTNYLSACHGSRHFEATGNQLGNHTPQTSKK